MSNRSWSRCYNSQAIASFNYLYFFLSSILLREVSRANLLEDINKTRPIYLYVLNNQTNFVRLDSFHCVQKQLQAISKYYKFSLVHSYSVQ